MYDARAIVGAPVDDALSYVMSELTSNPSARVYLFGYSAGGNAAVELADLLDGRGVPVQGLVTFDPHHHMRPIGAGTYWVPRNVGRALNFYQNDANPFRGGTVNGSFATDPNVNVTGSATHLDIVRNANRNYYDDIMSVFGR